MLQIYKLFFIQTLFKQFFNGHKGEHICTFDAINMDMKEFLVYLCKYNLLQNELFHT